jgi:hypothetical protein
VDRLTHSLQTASRAWRDGRDEEYVVCALLHDIGDTLAPTTTRTSPRRSSSRSSARELVDGGKHGSSRATTSSITWAWTGTCASNSATPAVPATIEFCAKYDAAAFDPDMKACR